MSLVARLLIAVSLALLLPAASLAVELPEPGKIEEMSAKELESFVDLVTAAVAQDSLKLPDAGRKGDCMELARIANSFALGYGYLGKASDSIDPEKEQQKLPLKIKIVQARVLAFASRVRAEEWNQQRCAAYEPPADQADNPRYQKPAKIQTHEFTVAIIEARQATEANLAGAVAAARSGKCANAMSAARGLQLLIPYVNKLLTDISERPLALGPIASRRGLEASRNQLAAAFNSLDKTFGSKCGVSPAVPPAAPSSPSPQGGA